VSFGLDAGDLYDAAELAGRAARNRNVRVGVTSPAM